MVKQNTQTCLKLSTELRERLEIMAKKKGRTYSQLIRNILTNAVMPADQRVDI